MTKSNASLRLSHLGERGFLKTLLPKISHHYSHRYLVPPGDDAAVLKTKDRLVLSIDGLTEGTHFKSTWAGMCEKIGGFTLGRGLGWKLMGCCLSDLAAMGATTNRWVITYLAAPGSTRVSFLNELQRGVLESARKYKCLIAGGDTVKGKDVSLVSAVGGNLKGRRALTRSGARDGDLLCIAGTLGDAMVGLRVLEKKIKISSKKDAAYFIRRFFLHEPLFQAGEILSQETGVTSGIDLSDALSETVQILSEASHVGAHVSVSDLPVSAAYRRLFDTDERLLAGGEDYALLFTLKPRALSPLRKRLRFSVIGRMRPLSSGITYFKEGRKVKKPTAFQHFR